MGTQNVKVSMLMGGLMYYGGLCPVLGMPLEGIGGLKKEELKDLIHFGGFLECDVPSKTYPDGRQS